MTYDQLQQLEAAVRADLGDDVEWFALYESDTFGRRGPVARLDGDFIAAELRRIADALDQAKETP